MTSSGGVYGRAGGGLNAGHVKGNKGQISAGIRGEYATARVLDALASQPDGPSVFHDLHIPGAGGNIDHAVVSGTTVWLIDSKCWKPGLYWRIGSKVYRGMSRFKVTTRRNGRKVVEHPAEKQTLAKSFIGYRNYLVKIYGPGYVDLRTPLLVVWSSSEVKKARVGLLSGGVDHERIQAVSGHRLKKVLREANRPADPAIVEAIQRLLIHT